MAELRGSSWPAVRAARSTCRASAPVAIFYSETFGTFGVPGSFLFSRPPDSRQEDGGRHGEAHQWPARQNRASSCDRSLTPTARDRDVLLVFPGRHRAPDPQVPLQLLHVASALQRAGYRPRIFDMRLADFHGLRIGDPVFVGITAMSGPQIRYGLEFARRVRAAKPAVPIVWGGVHPTLLPEQTAADPHVDVVVRGEAETVVGPLADALAAGAPLDSIRGLTFKTDGAITSTPDADLVDLDTIPIELPYDLLDVQRYPTLQAGRVHM